MNHADSFEFEVIVFGKTVSTSRSAGTTSDTVFEKQGACHLASGAGCISAGTCFLDGNHFHTVSISLECCLM